MTRLCSTCFNTSSYPPFFSKDSFDQVDVMLPGTVTHEWTEEETLKLFEAIERYGSSDWSAIASMVGGGKTHSQCLLHFSQLPMNERFSPVSNGANSVAPRINPFRDPHSSVLSLVNIMCATVPKEIGAVVAAALVTQDVEMH
jgi:SWI/SNF related-matrix-associated actin-dependent regulator of chromatin subfamily C